VKRMEREAPHHSLVGPQVDNLHEDLVGELGVCQVPPPLAACLRSLARSLARRDFGRRRDGRGPGVHLGLLEEEGRTKGREAIMRKGLDGPSSSASPTIDVDACVSFSGSP
jgi:hypothetical protein